MPRTVQREIPSFVYDPSCVLYLPLWKRDAHDGTSFISDDAHGYACSVTGATWGIQGRTFDNTDDFIQITQNGALNFSGAITVASWIKLTTIGTTDRSILSNQAPGTNSGFWFFVSSNSQLYFYVGNGTSWPNGGGSGAGNALTAGAWYFVVATAGAAVNGSLYINGVNVAQTTQGLTSNTTDLYIGRSSESASKWLNGLLGEASIYNRALTDAEVKQEYLATQWRYR